MAFVNVANNNKQENAAKQAINEEIPKSIEIIRNRRSNSHSGYHTLLRNPYLKESIEKNKVDLSRFEDFDKLEVILFTVIYLIMFINR